MDLNQIRSVVKGIQYRPNWDLVIREKNGLWYLQVHARDEVDTETGGSTDWHSRKWMLSPHMCETEVVNTAFMAFEMAERHEMCERFTYRGVRVKNPHLSMPAMASYLNREDSIEIRVDPMGSLD